MLDELWADILQDFEKNKTRSPITYSLFKQLHPVELTETTLVLSCANQGMKNYFETKRPIIEQALFTKLNKTITVQFKIEAKKKKEAEAPLLRFHPSQEDLFLKAGPHIKYK